ncbi:MAG: amino acid adenylation domain-containing protein [Rhizonema sp. PD38]|nr:amino acid adenylation domain-containing protein [Rhizonema sp. PD38]
MSDLSKRILELSPEKQKLLLQRLQKKQEQICPQTQILKAPRKSNSFPLSFAQARLWFLDQLEYSKIAYNISQSMHLKGRLNVAALEQSFHEVVMRHEILRTTFATVNGQLVQAIASSPNFTISVIDLTELPDIHTSQVQYLATKESKQPFDLTKGPLLRVKLLKLSETEYVLLLVMHHIVSDAKSCGIFVQEIAVLYEAFLAGKVSPLPDLSIQYIDFAYWQRQWLQQSELKEQLAYWKQQLANLPPALALPTDKPRPAVQSFAGATTCFHLSLSLSRKLHKLSQAEGVSLFMTLLAAFQTLLYRYTTQEDICIGLPIDNRERREIEKLIGCFINTLVLRTDLSGHPSFRELLSRTREVALGAYAHQDLPFEKLVEELQPERNLSYSPLFRVMFVLWSTPMPVLKLPGLSVSPLEINSGTARFDLTLALAETQQGLNGSIEYNTDIFYADTITRMVGHFQTLLESIVANPDQQLLDLPILTEIERHQLLVEWNSTQTNYPQDRCIHRMFEAQVELTPDAIAVIFEDEQLTYRVLNQRANQLAHYLQVLGVGPEILVGICIERSVEMVVGLLGILKAGGAYVPVDPTYPQTRLSFILSDSQVSVLLTTENLVVQLPEQKARVLCLDSQNSIITLESEENPVSNVHASNLAYVIYTSGSTGKPKGTMNTHRGISNRLRWMQDVYQLTAGDRILQKTPFSFDVSVWEFFCPLLTAGCLVVAQPGGHQDSAYLIRLIVQHNISILHFVPSMLQVFLQEQGLEHCSCLRKVICSGEVLPFKLQEQFFTRLKCELYNLYGPTEAAIDVTYWQCESGNHRKIVPIGRPIANTQIYILNAHLQPVSTGTSGEIYIGGISLARGYLTHPILTAEKFIPNPFSNEPGARLYKTGDLARYLSDGNIEYLGRLDHQVKIRGFRIELGEIEAVLSQHSEVQQTVVIDQEDHSSNKRLVAYIVPQPGTTPAVSNIRHFLQEKLPKYMLPSAFVMLEALPLTSNGKIDRQQLPQPEKLAPELATTYVAPQSPEEKMIATVWQAVLNVEKVGIYDNFFDLGGHSLLVVQVHSKLQEVFNKHISIVDLFTYPTISFLARYLSQEYSEQPNVEHNGKSISEILCERPDPHKALKQQRQRRKLGVIK